MVVETVCEKGILRTKSADLGDSGSLVGLRVERRQGLAVGSNGSNFERLVADGVGKWEGEDSGGCGVGEEQNGGGWYILR